MIARIVLGSISPCLRFSAFLSIIRDFASQFVTCIVSDCSTNFIADTKDCALLNDYLKVRESANRAVAKCISRCVILPIFETWASSNCNIYQRSYSYGDYIEHVWDKLPEHVKADSEVRIYCCCVKHYNQPWQDAHRPPCTEDKGL